MSSSRTRAMRWLQFIAVALVLVGIVAEAFAQGGAIGGIPTSVKRHGSLGSNSSQQTKP